VGIVSDVSGAATTADLSVGINVIAAALVQVEVGRVADSVCVQDGVVGTGWVVVHVSLLAIVGVTHVVSLLLFAIILISIHKSHWIGAHLLV
jgi:hypothetical protein